MNRRFYRFVIFVMRTIARVLFPYRVQGAGNVPADGACVICSNHTGNLDPLVLGAVCGRYVYFMAKKELFDFWLTRRAVTALGAFPVNRGENDLSAVRRALEVLREGEALGIFPEGTRERTGKEVEWHSGTALIAMRANVPVVPVRIDRAFRPLRVTHVIFGEPFRFTDGERRFDAASLARATDRIRAGSEKLTYRT